VPDKLTPEEVRDYWTAQARTHGLAPAASWSDVWAIQLEVRAIVKWLKDGDRVLDVGCGNGYSTVQFAAHKRVDIKGIDYVPEMVQQARDRAAQLATRLTGSVEFAVGDVTALGDMPDKYDCVTAVRVIINLGSWTAQERALLACAQAARPGGLMLLSEATLQGWTKLNRFRREWSLPPISMPAFNTYVDEEQVVRTLAPLCDLIELENFSSTYFVGTRVLKPLLAQVLDNGVDVADPNLQWNEWWAQLPAWGDSGTQKLFVFRRR
jgi:ubiquinone/menaquinone biosynthesis C-methylase UbiE